jgi:N-acetylated-alpha-linked acidic dipeptidase
VRERGLAALQVRAAGPEANPEIKALAKGARETGEVPVGDMGSGSDYTPFVQHLGIASINVGYGGEDNSGGVYHSVYDTFTHYTRFGDPTFAYGVALAQTGGRLVMRAADADLLPFAFANVARTVATEIDELEKLVATERDAGAAVDGLLDAKAYALAADPTLSWGPPERLEPVPTLDFGPLKAAVARLTTSAAAYDAAALRPAPAAVRAQVDVALQGAEQAITDPRGLPGRPWYVNMFYAPGLLTGYGAKTLPGVREAIEGRRWAEANAYIGRTAGVLDALSRLLDDATARLASATAQER